jgi:hypothetical protein
MPPAARTLEERKQDTLSRLEHDIDVWVATAHPTSGTPHLVPLSFLWDGSTLLLATPSASPTGRNLMTTGQVRLGVGLTRDVVIIEGTVQSRSIAQTAVEEADAFAAKAGFDPRRSTASYRYFQITPQRILAWREENELASRELMRDGAWCV